MERDANYVAVGAFAVLVIAMAVVFVLWYSSANDRREYQLYEIYFNGSVSGLNEGSPVRYLGVDVGRVRRLSIDRNRPGSVQVIVEVDAAAPISMDTRASLGLQGVTGLLYINLRQADDSNGQTQSRKGDRYPIIESQASDFDVFLSSLPELMARATSLIDRVSTLFSTQNIEALSASIESLRATTQKLPQTVDSAGELIRELQATVAEINAAAVDLRGITADARPQVRQVVERFNAVADSFASTSRRLDQLMASSEVQIGHLSEHGLFELERLLRDARSAAQEFRELSRSLKENPSQLLYEPPAGGMEIER